MHFPGISPVSFMRSRRVANAGQLGTSVNPDLIDLAAPRRLEQRRSARLAPREESPRRGLVSIAEAAGNGPRHVDGVAREGRRVSIAAVVLATTSVGSLRVPTVEDRRARRRESCIPRGVKSSAGSGAPRICSCGPVARGLPGRADSRERSEPQKRARPSSAVLLRARVSVPQRTAATWRPNPSPTSPLT